MKNQHSRPQLAQLLLRIDYNNYFSTMSDRVEHKGYLEILNNQRR